MAEPLLRVRGLKKHYAVKGSKKLLRAVDGVDLDIFPGETLGLVGESGCGKSTLGKCILRLTDVSEGSIEFESRRIEKLSFSQMRPLRTRLQMVFQNPYSSLNPRMTILQSVMAPLNVAGGLTKQQRREKAAEALACVGLGAETADRLPNELSGGQRQRAVTARAIVGDPSFIVCDEPVSALDASVRSSVLNLLKKLQRERGCSYLFISHDLSVIRFLCDRVAVMYLGHIVELASRAELFENPRHPYTRALLSAIPVPDVDVKRERILLGGDVPSPMDPPSGCPFRTRCPSAQGICAESKPELKELSDGHFAACHFAGTTD